MTAKEVRDALRRRHPAAMQGSMVGQWTCLEEWADIDLIALDAWSNAAVVGYEVKVSRSDMRQELLAPAKRADAVAMCTEFYFAVPAGMLKPDEIAYEEPEWTPDDFHRMRCPGLPPFGPPDPYAVRRHRPTDLLDVPPGRYGGPCQGRGRTGTYKAGTRQKGPFRVRLPLPLALTEAPETVTTQWRRAVGPPTRYHLHPMARVALEGDELHDALAHWAEHHLSEAERAVLCPTCGGKGYLERSRVEAEAPTLWVPRDVGLIEVSGRGCRVTRKSPKRLDAPGLLPAATDAATPRAVRAGRQRVAKLIRWTSNRPDPRHAIPAPLHSTSEAA